MTTIGDIHGEDIGEKLPDCLYELIKDTGIEVDREAPFDMMD